MVGFSVHGVRRGIRSSGARVTGCGERQGVDAGN